MLRGPLLLVAIGTLQLHVPVVRNVRLRDHERQEICYNITFRSIVYSEALCGANAIAFPQRLALLDLAPSSCLNLVKHVFVQPGFINYVSLLIFVSH